MEEPRKRLNHRDNFYSDLPERLLVLIKQNNFPVLSSSVRCRPYIQAASEQAHRGPEAMYPRQSPTVRSLLAFSSLAR